MTDRLARRYARWLRCYPPGRRRVEMLSTLLDCAPPERTRPTAQEAGNLLRFGLRARLGRPASRSVVALSLLVALTAGLMGAAAAARIAWEFAPPLPSGAAAQELKETAFPGLPAYGGDDAEIFTTHPLEWVPQFGAAEYWVRHTPETRNVKAYAEGVRDRLAAAGWQIRSDITVVDDTAGSTQWAQFWATRNGLALYYDNSYTSTDPPSDDSDGTVSFELSRSSAPPWLAGSAVSVGLLTAVAGWLLFGWASRRSEGHPLRTAGSACLAVLPVLLVVVAALAVAEETSLSNRPAQEALWGGLHMLNDGFGLLALLCTLGALAVAAPPSRVRVAVSASMAVLALAMAGMAAGVPSRLRGTCAPTGPPAVTPAAAQSPRAWIYVVQGATDQQRKDVEDAINRTGELSPMLIVDPADEAYRYAYCDGRELAGDSGWRVPHVWRIWLPSTDVYPELVAAVSQLPGVVAVRQTRQED
ncbi:hypothetical protein [Actinoplanes sp. NPDC051859]|uniref:hypothetical protein n=1 Tax=Actinoplanes sp. NPDC051859 TaxID=3363909 RepID=UPI0037A947B2